METDGRKYNSKSGFLAFKLPGENEAVYKRCTISYNSELNGFNQCDFVFAPFDKYSTPTLFLNYEETYNSFENLEFELIDDSSEHSNYSDYLEQYLMMQNAFVTTKLSKLVLSRKKIVNRGSLRPSYLFEELIRLHPDAFSYLLYIPGEMCWIGSSPEPVLEQTDNGLLTTALAGTKALDSPIEDIKWGPKERDEQNYIVDYLDHAFKNNEISFKRSDPYTVAAGKLCHIRSDYYVFENRALENLMNIIHPGPALSGFPKDLAETTIPQIERHQRKYYTGFFGTTIRDNKLCLFANLRCMELTQESAILYLGGGITSDSNPESEWQETELKASTMLSALISEYQAVPNDNI